MSPGRAELSLFKGKPALFVFVLMSGAAFESAGNRIIPSSASAIVWGEVSRLNREEVSVFKASWSEQFGDRVGVVFKGITETCPDLFWDASGLRF